MPTKTDPTPPKRLVDRVQRLRGDRKMSQAALAEAIGVRPPQMSRLLSGAREFNASHVEALAKAFGLPIADLLAGTDHEDDIKAMGALVPRAEYEGVLEKLAEALAKVQELEAAHSRIDAEQTALRAQLIASESLCARAAEEAAAERARADESSLATAVARRERDEARLSGDAAKGERDAAAMQAREQRAQSDALRRGLGVAQSQVRQHEATIAGLQSEVRQLQVKLWESNRQVNANFDAYKQMEARVGQLRAQLQQAGQSTVGASLLTAVIGLGLGAAIAAGNNQD